MCNLVMPYDADTYFNVDHDTCLNNSIHLKQIWVVRCQKFVYASLKRAKQDAK